MVGLGLAVVGITALWRACCASAAGRRPGPLAGTTLVGPCRWAMAAIAAIVATEVAASVAHGPAHTGWLELLRYSSALLALCPFVALLGAKRPQQRAWQFVVASFWIVMQTPSGTWWLFRSTDTLKIAGPWAGLLLLLMLMQCGNYVATRAVWAALMATAGQWITLAPFLNLPAGATGNQLGVMGPTVGPALLVGSVLAAHAAARRLSPRLSAPDAVWRDFRDCFGAFWALRIAARMNVAAETHGWNVRLRWSGWSHTDTKSSVEVLPPPAEKCFRMLLRRFMDPGRVATRISTGPASRLD